MSLLHTVHIGPGEITFGEAEIVNGIQQAGFAGAVVAADANNIFFKFKRTVAVVFELSKGYGAKTEHGSKIQGSRHKAQGTRNKEQGTRDKGQGTRDKAVSTK